MGERSDAAQWSPSMASRPLSMLRRHPMPALDLRWSCGLSYGCQWLPGTCRSEDSHDAWFINASKCSWFRGGDCTTAMWTSISLGYCTVLSSWQRSSQAVQMAVVGHRARRLPIRAVGFPPNLTDWYGRFDRDIKGEPMPETRRIPCLPLNPDHSHGPIPDRYLHLTPVIGADLMAKPRYAFSLEPTPDRQPRALCTY